MPKLRNLLLAAIILSVTGCLIRPIGHGGSDGWHDEGRGHDQGKGHGKGNDRGHGGDGD